MREPLPVSEAGSEAGGAHVSHVPIAADAHAQGWIELRGSQHIFDALLGEHGVVSRFDSQAIARCYVDAGIAQGQNGIHRRRRTGGTRHIITRRDRTVRTQRCVALLHIESAAADIAPGVHQQVATTLFYQRSGGRSRHIGIGGGIGRQIGNIGGGCYPDVPSAERGNPSIEIVVARPPGGIQRRGIYGLAGYGIDIADVLKHDVARAINIAAALPEQPVVDHLRKRRWQCNCGARHGGSRRVIWKVRIERYCWLIIGIAVAPCAAQVLRALHIIPGINRDGTPA